MLTIANPIYDVFFKYLMQDEAAATCLLSAVLDQEITLLECLPQERMISSEKRPELSVIRFDFRATIKLADGTLKKVLIELQKIRRIDDIGRFRRYLASNYATPDKIQDENENPREVHLPIITIYLLGFKLGILSPVTRVGDVYTDMYTKESFEGSDQFIDALTHHAYFIQIPRLPGKQQTRVQRVLSIFSQEWVVETGSKRIMQIPEDLRTEDNEPLVHRLSLAVVDHELQQIAIEVEAFDKELLNELDQQFEKGIEQGIEKGKTEGKLEGLLETAQNLKAMGLSVEQILQATGLKLAEIEVL